MLESAEERGCSKREDQLEHGVVPRAPVLPGEHALSPACGSASMRRFQPCCEARRMEVGRDPRQLGGRGRREALILSRSCCRLLLEDWSGWWVGIVPSDPMLIPCACCRIHGLSQASSWVQFTAPYFSSSQPPLPQISSPPQAFPLLLRSHLGAGQKFLY